MLESCAHQVGTLEFLEHQCGTGDQLGAAWGHCSQRSRGGENAIQSQKESCQMHLTPNVCERKTLKHVILSDENPRKMDNFVFSIPRSTQSSAEGPWLWRRSHCALHCTPAVSCMGLSNTSEIPSVTMVLSYL